MNEQDYIRKAVELADGWEWNWSRPFCNKVDCKYSLVPANQPMEQWQLDALAAQLVRQVESLPIGEFPDDAPSAVYQTPHEVQVWHKKRIVAIAAKDDRTMNTIRAIVDSGVLE